MVRAHGRCTASGPVAGGGGGESASISCVEVRDVWTSDVPVLCSLQMITRLP